VNFLKMILSLALCFLLCNVAGAQTVGEYVHQAEEKSRNGDIEAAITVMEKALEEFPNDPTAHAWLGGYLGRSAGDSDDMMLKATRSGKAFEHLDKAVALDSLHVMARFFRGLMGVMVPAFLGKLDQGIGDLNTVLDIAEAEPKSVPDDIITQTYNVLGTGYSKKGQKDEAKKVWAEVVQRAPDSDMAREAQSQLKKLTSEPPQQRTEDEGVLKKSRGDLGTAIDYIEKGAPEKAVELLKKVMAEDSTNARAQAWLGMAYASLAGEGYDERIAQDTDLRTNFALQGYQTVDEAVAMAPDDPEIRFLRGMLGAQLPSFMEKTDQAIADLDTVIETAASDELKSQALYALGSAYQRKGLSVWEELITRYPKSEAVQTVFEKMTPRESTVEVIHYPGPIVIVRFAIGFETELQPQTAVWVEDEGGKFVKTLYVSGFSGHVGATQVVLTKWAEASDFETDATTGASIAAGWHSYIWDVTDHNGRGVQDGTYTINVEVHHWPSMEYQLASAPIDVGGPERVSKVKVGNLIPFLEVRYVPVESER
jgi:tetratricopeptide (TPR) repeat protein